MPKYTAIPPEWIDSEATQSEFGYHPNELTPQSGKPIVAICQQCHGRRSIRKVDTRAICRNCADKNSGNKRAFLNTLTILPSHIDIKKTIKKFGYDPCLLSRNSQKFVVAHCYICNKIRIVKMQSAMKYPACIDCSHNDPMSTKNRASAQIELNKIRGRRIVTNETKAKISKSHIARAAIKGSPHSKGLWYSTVDNEQVYLRSSYEVKVAEYFDCLGISWVYEPKGYMVSFLWDGGLTTRSYWPDFYLSDFGIYVEVKGYWRAMSALKHKAFLEQYPDIMIDVWEKPILQTMGIL